MTEDELLAQIRTVDPDAYVTDRGGFRTIVTSSIDNHTIVLINADTLEILPMMGWHSPGRVVQRPLEWFAENYPTAAPSND